MFCAATYVHVYGDLTRGCAMYMHMHVIVLTSVLVKPYFGLDS